jgi:hypothetical protein
MRRLPTAFAAACLAAALLDTAVAAQEPAAGDEAAASGPAAFAPVPAAEADLAAYQWTLRPIVVFADTPQDPRFAEQMRNLEAGWADLERRGVVLITDTDPAADTAIRRKLRPRGFMLVLIDKDGRVALRKPFPWDVRELGRAIDRMERR